jgi:hypothetical protein
MAMNREINFKQWNNFGGLIVFLLSAFIYLSTIEPTGSFWDCGEFASCCYKLEICHAPGSPLFLLIGRIASLFAGSDTSKVAMMINAYSAIASALTIMFLFWTITWFGRKILSKTWQNSNTHKLLILFSGITGAMAYAVSDSFWFSAVEAEVYAMSSLFTALVFWCILKWEEEPTETSSRWLLLIAYLFGLSIGVHLLNLLAIPSIIMVYYFKNYTVNWKNSLIALSISAAILLAVIGIIIPGIPAIMAQFELLAVNRFNLPLNSGYMLGGGFIIAMLGFGFFIAKKKKLIWIHNALLLLSLTITGYSTYAMVVIRAHDNPPINMNQPEDPFSLSYYLNREQYEKRDLFYGASFASPIVGSTERSSYERLNGKYIPMPLMPAYQYDKNTLMLFPRMGSNAPEHIDAYKKWSNFKGQAYSYTNQNGKTEQIMLPTFSDNLSFFFNYQLGYMYFRYFMWNFAGRQNDVQGHGNVQNGNWLSGISLIDNARLGPQDKITSAMKNNKARNTYFLLPLLLGLAGLWFHYKKDKHNFGVLALLFFFTGIAIILYMNEIPTTPRERDYVHVGSFYVFAVWIGIGCLALASWVKYFKLKENQTNTLIIIASILTFSVPIIMLWQNWDDHNRSNRYWVRQYSRNYLNSCEPNAIIFTNADNDTYPLWYAQEIEGVRRDVRIILLPYLATDWYTNQMRQAIYNQDGIKMSWTKETIAGGKRTYLPIVNRIDTAIDVSSALAFTSSDDSRTKIEMANGEMLNYLPGNQLSIPINKKSLKVEKNRKADDRIIIKLQGNYITLDKIMLLDIIQSNPNRPIYFTSPQEPISLGLDKYLKLDGCTYKLTAYKTQPKTSDEIGFVDTDQLYDQYMNKLEWSSLSDPNVYHDSFHLYTTATMGIRQKFCRLANALIDEGKNEKAIKVLDKISEIMPNDQAPYDYNNLNVAALYLQAGAKAKGEAELQKMQNITQENTRYYLSLSPKQQATLNYEMQLNQYLIQQIATIKQSLKL